MYPRIPWEMVVDPLRPAEHTLGVVALCRNYFTHLSLGLLSADLDRLSSILRCFDVLTGCSKEFLSSRIRYPVAERVATDVSKRREPFSKRHSTTHLTTILPTDFFPSHPRYRYSPSLIQSVKMNTAAPLLLWIQIPIPVVKLELLSRTEEF
jgi:hypothetical protein